MSSIYTLGWVNPQKDYQNAEKSTNDKNFYGVWSPTNIEGVVGAGLALVGGLAAIGVIPGGSGLAAALIGTGGALFLDALTAHAIHSVKMLLKRQEKEQDTNHLDVNQATTESTTEYIVDSENSNADRTSSDARARLAGVRSAGRNRVGSLADAASGVASALRNLFTSAVNQEDTQEQKIADHLRGEGELIARRKKMGKNVGSRVELFDNSNHVYHDGTKQEG